MTHLDRRGLLKAACVGCAALGLAACGGSSAPAPAAEGSAAAEPTGSAAAEPSAGAASPSAAAAGNVIVKLAAIPVGGSISGRASGSRIVLARPTATTVVAFSSTCTHQQCTVEPNGRKYSCPCHGSEYDAFTGKNVSGPAPSPLTAVAVKISGADVVEA
jgi:Rieske Fe-S protein